MTGELERLLQYVLSYCARVYTVHGRAYQICVNGKVNIYFDKQTKSHSTLESSYTGRALTGISLHEQCGGRVHDLVHEVGS